MKSVGILVGVLFTVFTLYVLIAGSITLVLKTKIGQGDPKGFWYTNRDTLKKYIFKSWINWAGSPATFSYLESVQPASYTVLKTITGTGAKLANCMIQCESNTKCEGFIFNKTGTANTCMLVTGMDVLVPSSTSNTMYFVDGKEPTNQFFATASKTVGSPQYILGSPQRETTYIPCASNCASNIECTGFFFDSGVAAPTPNCSMVKNSEVTLADAGTAITSYKLGPHSAFTASTTPYYSTSK